MKTPPFDYCQYMKRAKKGNSIVEMVADQILKTSTLPTDGCPIPAGKYFVNGFKLDGSKFASFVPPGIYVAYYYLSIMKNKVKVIILCLKIKLEIL